MIVKDVLVFNSDAFSLEPSIDEEGLQYDLPVGDDIARYLKERLKAVATNWDISNPVWEHFGAVLNLRQDRKVFTLVCSWQGDNAWAVVFGEMHGCLGWLLNRKRNQAPLVELKVLVGQIVVADADRFQNVRWIAEDEFPGVGAHWIKPGKPVRRRDQAEWRRRDAERRWAVHTSRHCPKCGSPCPDYRKRCYVCEVEIGFGREWLLRSSAPKQRETSLGTLAYSEGLWHGKYQETWMRAAVELLIEGDNLGPSEAEIATIRAFVDKCQENILLFRRRLFMGWSYFPIRIAVNRHGTLGVEFQSVLPLLPRKTVQDSDRSRSQV
jgi:hypothetical protein